WFKFMLGGAWTSTVTATDRLPRGRRSAEKLGIPRSSAGGGVVVSPRDGADGFSPGGTGGGAGLGTGAAPDWLGGGPDPSVRATAGSVGWARARGAAFFVIGFSSRAAESFTGGRSPGIARGDAGGARGAASGPEVP